MPSCHSILRWLVPSFCPSFSSDCWCVATSIAWCFLAGSVLNPSGSDSCLSFLLLEHLYWYCLERQCEWWSEFLIGHWWYQFLEACFHYWENCSLIGASGFSACAIFRWFPYPCNYWKVISIYLVSYASPALVQPLSSSASSRAYRTHYFTQFALSNTSEGLLLFSLQLSWHRLILTKLASTGLLES